MRSEACFSSATRQAEQGEEGSEYLRICGCREAEEPGPITQSPWLALTAENPVLRGKNHVDSLS